MRSHRAMTAIAIVLALVGLSACGSDDSTGDQAAATPAVTAPSPPATGTLVDVAAADPELSILAATIQAAGLTETFRAPGPYTLFAPTNKAFEAMPDSLRDKLLKPDNKTTLAQILVYHVVPSKMSGADLSGGMVTTLEGSALTVESKSANKATVDGAKVTEKDITATNGVVHLVDHVLLPSDVDLKSL